MNAIDLVRATAVVTPFSAPSPTSASTAPAMRRHGARAASRCQRCEHEGHRVPGRLALAPDFATAFVAGNVLFVHTGNVVALTAGRALAQPAV